MVKIEVENLIKCDLSLNFSHLGAALTTITQRLNDIEASLNMEKSVREGHVSRVEARVDRFTNDISNQLMSVVSSASTSQDRNNISRLSTLVAEQAKKIQDLEQKNKDVTVESNKLSLTLQFKLSELEKELKASKTQLQKAVNKVDTSMTEKDTAMKARAEILKKEVSELQGTQHAEEKERTGLQKVIDRIKDDFELLESRTEANKQDINSLQALHETFKSDTTVSSSLVMSVIQDRLPYLLDPRVKASLEESSSITERIDDAYEKITGNLNKEMSIFADKLAALMTREEHIEEWQTVTSKALQNSERNITDISTSIAQLQARVQTLPAEVSEQLLEMGVHTGGSKGPTGASSTSMALTEQVVSLSKTVLDLKKEVKDRLSSSSKDLIDEVNVAARNALSDIEKQLEEKLVQLDNRKPDISITNSHTNMLLALESRLIEASRSINKGTTTEKEQAAERQKQLELKRAKEEQERLDRKEQLQAERARKQQAPDKAISNQNELPTANTNLGNGLEAGAVAEVRKDLEEQIKKLRIETRLDFQQLLSEVTTLLDEVASTSARGMWPGSSRGVGVRYPDGVISESSNNGAAGSRQRPQSARVASQRYPLAPAQTSQQNQVHTGRSTHGAGKDFHQALASTARPSRPTSARAPSAANRNRNVNSAIASSFKAGNVIDLNVAACLPSVARQL